MDDVLRGLERELWSGGFTDNVRYAVNLERVGRFKEALKIYCSLLSDKPQDEKDYLLVQQGILRVGLPCVEFEPVDAPETVRFYNVMHKSFDDETRVPYVFTWDKELFKHSDRTVERNGMDCFTQENLSNILTKEKIMKRPPTASAVHSHVLMLEEIAKLGVQTKDVRRARSFIRQHLRDWALTWTQIDCDKPSVIQNYDAPEQCDDMDVRGVDGYLRHLCPAGDGIKSAVLCAEQSIEELDKMYNKLLVTQNGTYVWRPAQQATGKRVVVLGRGGGSGGFGIDCDVGDWPARLVFSSRKNLCHK